MKSVILSTQLYVPENWFMRGKKKSPMLQSSGLQLLGLWSETAWSCAQAKLLADHYQFAQGGLAESKPTAPAGSKPVSHVPINSQCNLNSCAYLKK